MTNQHQQLAKGEETQAQRMEQPKRRTVFSPPVDIIETAGEVILLADIPGVDEKNIDCTLEAGVLTLRATTGAAVPEGMRLIDGEFVPGDFQRVFSLSDEIDQENIKASVKNGVLHLRLPKAKAAKARKIEIQTG